VGQAPKPTYPPVPIAVGWSSAPLERLIISAKFAKYQVDRDDYHENLLNTNQSQKSDQT
jgi:hypothetical protein